MARHVLVYRRDLFRLSEPFIHQQAEAHSWLVTYIGRRLGGSVPPGARYHLFASPQQLHRIVGDTRYDIVHAHFGTDIPDGLRVAQILDVPLAVTLHGFDVTRTRRSCVLSGRPNLIRYGARRPHWLRSADRYFAVSAFVAEQAMKAGAPKDRVEVHHVGTSLKALTGESRRRRSPSSPLHILHVARLVEKKGTAYLIAAVARAVGNGLNVRLTVVGDGPLKGSLIRLVNRLGASDHVTFVGAQPHARTIQAIARADALCLPSVTARNGDAEGLGMVLLEAAATGTAIIASASGGIPDFVESDVTGLLVTPGDSNALFQAIARLSRDPVLAERLAASALRRAQGEFDVRVQTSALEARFESMLASRGRQGTATQGEWSSAP